MEHETLLREHNQKPATPKLAMSVPEIVESIGCCPAQVYNLARRGLIPLRRMGSRTVGLTREIEAAIEQLPTAKFTYGKAA